MEIYSKNGTKVVHAPVVQSEASPFASIFPQFELFSIMHLEIALLGIDNGFHGGVSISITDISFQASVLLTHCSVGLEPRRWMI